MYLCKSGFSKNFKAKINFRSQKLQIQESNLQVKGKLGSSTHLS